MMDHMDLLNQLESQIYRLGLYYNKEAQSWCSCLLDQELVLLLRFLNKLSKFYSKKGK